MRQFSFDGSLDYILIADTGHVEARQNELRFETEFENSDRFDVSFRDYYELLEEPFSPATDVTIPIGGYDFRDVEVSYSLGEQRVFSGSLAVRTGGYFSGDITSIDFHQGRVEGTQQLSVEPSLSLNWIDLPEGSFRTELLRARINYTFTPRMFCSGLLQYNSSNEIISSNLRLRWEYQPGSELFISLHGGTGHRSPAQPFLGAPQSRLRRQGQPLVSILNGGSTSEKNRTCHRPIDGTGFELTSAILRDLPNLPRSRGSSGLRNMIQRCLAKDPGDRYQRASDVGAVLEALSAAPRKPSRRKS